MQEPCLQSYKHAHSGYSSACSCAQLREVQPTSEVYANQRGSVKQTESTGQGERGGEGSSAITITEHSMQKLPFVSCIYATDPVDPEGNRLNQE